MRKATTPMEQHVQQVQQQIQNPGSLAQAWNWVMLGMGGIITYLHNQVRGKASRREVDALAGDIDEKVSKDQFTEFKEGNTALHKSNGAKLDTLIAHITKRPSRSDPL